MQSLRIQYSVLSHSVRLPNRVFAIWYMQWDNIDMPRQLTLVFHIMVGAMLLGYAPAQQTPAAPPSTGSKQTTSAPKTAAKKPATAGSRTSSAGSALALKTQKEKASYALGANIGTGLHRQGVSVDPAIVARGLKDAMTGGKMLMTDDEIKAAIVQLRSDVTKQQEAKAHAAGEGNRKESEAFLAANKSKEGIKELPNGLQYKVLTEGTGPKPTASDTVSVNYRGTLPNGTEFDSSAKHGGPASFPVGGVIRGWTEALQQMPVGSKWELYIPPDLAYGDNPPPGSNIPAGSALIFEVELLSIGQKK
jgi:FKBP-type peptidyl-prolyl cis-trans isomerase FklB